MKKNILIAVAFVVALVGGLKALQIDPQAEFWSVNWLSSGVSQFREYINSSGQKVLQENVSVNGPIMINDDNTGGLQIRPLTSAQMATLTPPASGYLYINITRATLCVSSGATQGALIAMSTGSTNDVIQFNSCYK